MKRLPLLLAIVLLTFLFTSHAAAFSLQKICDFSDWWTYSEGGMQITSNDCEINIVGSPRETDAWGNMAQDTHTTSVGIMTTIDIQQMGSCAQAGIIHYDIGHLENDNLVQIMFSVQKCRELQVISVWISERLSDDGSFVRDILTGNVAFDGDSVTLGLARNGNTILLYAKRKGAFPTIVPINLGLNLGIMGATSGVYGWCENGSDLSVEFSNINMIYP